MMVNRLRGVIGSAALVALIAAGAAAYAQGPGVGGPRGRGFGGPGQEPAGIELRGLDLSEAQRQQIQQLTQQYRDQVFAVLTPEQQQVVQQRRAEREARMKERLERLQQRQGQQQ